MHVEVDRGRAAHVWQLLPPEVSEAVRLLDEQGGEPYLVGGTVRDILLGREPKDYDIATRLRPHEVAHLFRESGWHVDETGAKYGVVRVIHPETGRVLDVSTFRREVYGEVGGRRYVTVIFVDDIMEDLGRRDFTVNAMAIDTRGELIDPFNGVDDLKRGIIRFVGKPRDRIREDPLRVLRAIRLAAELGFRLDASTEEAVRRSVNMLFGVSGERIGEELLAAARSHAFTEFVRLMFDTDVYVAVLPELRNMSEVRDFSPRHHGETVLEHTLTVLKRVDMLHRAGTVAGREAVILKLAALLHDIGKPYTFTLECIASTCVSRFPDHEKRSANMAEMMLLYYLRVPRAIVDPVVRIVRYHHVPYSIPAEKLPQRLLSKPRYRPIARLLLLHAYADSGDEAYLEAARRVEQLEKQPKPLVNGHDIMRIYGVPPGPKVGYIKEKLYEIQLTYGLTEKKQVIEKACQLGIICPASPGDR